MAEIPVYRMRTQRIDRQRFQQFAEHLEIKGQVVESEEALLVHDERSSLAYAQPGSKFSGLLLFTDRTRSLATIPKHLIGAEEAGKWTNEFLGRSDLRLPKIDEEKVRFKAETRAFHTQAVVFDGKERRRVPGRAEVSARFELNDIPVMGVRARLRAVFHDITRPVLLLRCLFDKLELHETRELVRVNDAYMLLREKLATRKDCKPNWNLLGTRLAYVAAEYCGGPDLLAPYYLLEVEYSTGGDQVRLGRQGPRQMFRFPAYR
jgi:hypothetical protein